MRRAAASARPRTRSRKAAASVPAAPSAPPRNVGSIEALLSLVAGASMVLAAVLPRTFKQLFLLLLGGGLAYRGLTGNCEVYRAAGIDTARGSISGPGGANPSVAPRADS